MHETDTSPRNGDLVSRALQFFVHSNLLISCSATGTAVATMVLADLSPRPIPLFIVFAVTMFVYWFNRIADYAEDKRNVPTRAAFVSRYGKPLLVLGGVLYLGAIAAAVLLGAPGAPAVAIPLVVALLYSTVGLKRVLLVKNLLVGVSWGLIPIGVGVYYGAFPDSEIIFFAAFTAAILTVAAVVFDIKDVEGDRAEGIRTVPIVVGSETTRRLAAGSALVLGALVAGLVVSGILPPKYGVLIGYAGYVAGYSLFATRERGPLFYGFVIDVEHALLALVLVGYEILRSGGL